MTATGRMTAGGDPKRSRQLAANLSATLATLMRKPRATDGRRPSWASPAHLLIGALIAIAAIAAAMAFLDGRAIIVARNLPPWLVATFDEITDYGKSGWFLVPAGILLIVFAAAGIRELPHFTRLVLAALTVRLGFLFLAIGVPGLFVTILKRLIGRARPLVVEDGGNLVVMPFIWRVGIRQLPLRPRHDRFRRSDCDWCALAAHARDHVDLRLADRAKPRGHNRALPERCHRQRLFRRSRCDPGARLVRRPPAWIRG